jgi:hypothetical protein
VQSSGVDYLHLLIVSMDYLIKKYGIKARYLISVHDEVRYLAKRTTSTVLRLHLQIANAWTRALFCFNLGLDDMPQGIAFFSAWTWIHILRKETDMTCVTPSHPSALDCGESLDINAVLGVPRRQAWQGSRQRPLGAWPTPGRRYPSSRTFSRLPMLASSPHRRAPTAQVPEDGSPSRHRWTTARVEAETTAVAVEPCSLQRRRSASRKPKAEVYVQLPDDEPVYDAYEARGHSSWSDADLSEALHIQCPRTRQNQVVVAA